MPINKYLNNTGYYYYYIYFRMNINLYVQINELDVYKNERCYKLLEDNL